MKHLEKFQAISKALIINSDDPVDPGFDVIINYVCDRDPTASEPLIYNNLPGLILIWQNTISKEYFFCADNTADAMIWFKMITDGNVLSYIPPLPANLSDAEIGTVRGWHPISLGLNTARQPSITNDVEVGASFNFTTLLSTSSTIEFQISPDNSTWMTIGTLNLDLGLSSNKTLDICRTIPANYYYKFVDIGSGIVSIVNHFELIK